MGPLAALAAVPRLHNHPRLPDGPTVPHKDHPWPQVGVDLAYNLHSSYGNWFPGCKPLVIQVGGEWVGGWSGGDAKLPSPTLPVPQPLPALPELVH